jgi:heptosyltransferase-2
MRLKLLIRTPNHLGDCIMALPMINEAREAYPDSEVTVLTPDHLAELFSRNPGIDQVVTIPTEHVHGLLSVFKIKDLVAPEDYDIGYILPPSFGAASAFKLAGIRERIGYIADGRRLLLTKPLPLPVPLNSEHRSKVYFDLLRRGSGATIDYFKPKLFLDQDDADRVSSMLEGFGVGPEDAYGVLAFRAVAESRRWGRQNYTELAARMVGEFGMKVILVGSAGDRDIGDAIVADSGHEDQVVNLAGKTSLRELSAVCSRARVFVGNDSGPAHLAAAVGAPVVVLSGADNPNETSPMASRKRLIYHDHLECISCVKNKCPLKGDAAMRCMTEISVDEVMAAVKDVTGGAE